MEHCCSSGSNFSEALLDPVGPDEMEAPNITFNNNNNNNTMLIFDYQEVRITFIILYSIVFCFCFFGNLIVVLVSMCHWKMRSVTKFCLCNLAFANLCVGIFCIMQNLSLFLVNRWIFGKILCKTYHFVNSLSHTASILILVVISVERYLVIIHPLKCKRILTIRRLRLAIAGVWILSAALSAPKLYLMVIIPHSVETTLSEASALSLTEICVPLASAYDLETAETIQFVALFLLPLGIISTLHLRIVLFLRRRESFDRTAGLCPASGSYYRCWGMVGSSRSSESDNRRDSPPAELLAVTEAELLRTSNSSTIRGQMRDDSRSAGVAPNNPHSLFHGPESERSNGNRRGRYCNRLEVRYGASYIRINYAHPLHELNDCRSWPCPRSRVTSIYHPYKTVNRILVSVVLCFTLCNLPFHLRKLYENYAPDPDYSSPLSELSIPLTFLLMYTNCAINPFLYGLLSRSFCSCFVDLLRCQLRKPQQLLSSSSARRRNFV